MLELPAFDNLFAGMCFLVLPNTDAKSDRQVNSTCNLLQIWKVVCPTPSEINFGLASDGLASDSLASDGWASFWEEHRAGSAGWAGSADWAGSAGLNK